MIEEGLSVLDPMHPEAMTGRSHLSAVIDGHTCGCGHLSITIEDAFREFVLAKLSPDLLADLSVTLEDDEFKIDAQLSREPTEEELERGDLFAQAGKEAHLVAARHPNHTHRRRATRHTI